MVYEISLPDYRYGKLKPNEDSSTMEGNVLCVADGVTRDPLYPKDFFGDKGDKREFFKNYPRPSRAKTTADLFCKELIKTIKKENKISKTAVRSGFLAANNAIADLNKRYIKKVDYLVSDYYACVASVAVIENNRIFWGFITDCGVIVFDKKGKLKFKTPNQMKDFEGYRDKVLKIDWRKADDRKLVRSQYRNKPEKIVNGKLISYGALTGEKEAEYFMSFGELGFEIGDLVIVYTDGFEETLTHKDFLKKFRTKEEFINFSNKLASQDYYLYGKERTLAAIEIE